MKGFIFLSLITVIIASCNKGGQPIAACETKACTYQFAYVTIGFTDKSNTAVAVKDVTAVNQRTGLKLDVKPSNFNPNSTNNYVIADDNMLSKFSTEGDDVLISATHSTTNQTKVATVNIAGGCNCHVDRKSGPAEIVFD